MKTAHHFLHRYPINSDSRALTLGTIHPHHIDNFDISFFYRNQISISRLLKEAFPGEIGTPIALPGILGFLSRNKIPDLDTIVEYEKLKDSALDKNLHPIRFHQDLIQQIRQSEITEIFFTSKFGKNNACRDLAAASFDPSNV